MTAFSALVLAGSRGADDPVAKAGGVDHKILVEIAGKAMIDHVLAAALAAPSVGRVAVVSNIGEAVSRRLPSAVRHIEGGDGPSQSVLRGVEGLERAFPILVLTADNPLLTPERIESFCAESLASGADVTAGLTPSAVVLERFPDARRTFLKFKDERYSGTNLFAILRPAGLKAIDFWRSVEADRKNPAKLASHFGMTTAALFMAGKLTLAEGVQRLSKKVGVAAQPIQIRDPLAPVDVDTPEDLALVRSLMAEET